MKFWHYISLALAILCLWSCSARYHIEKAKKKGAIIESDTVYQEIIIPSSKSDTVTVVRPINFHDTITIETTKWRTRTLITRDTVHNRDTIWQEVTCPEKRIIVPVEVNTDIDCPKRKFPWWLLLVGLGLGAGGVLFLKMYLR